MLRTTGDRWRMVLAGIAIAAVGISGCGSDDSAGDDSTVTVFAAASLTEAFTALGEEFEAANDGTELRFSFAASSELAAQIDSGAPADVFASADEPNMDKVVSAGLTEGDPSDFAGNVLEIAVPPGNPGRVKGLEDFSRKDLLLAVCDTEVPCGNAAVGVFGKAGVDAAVDSYEPDVKSVLTKVELGEVDAGLVYHSDVLAAGGRVDSIEIPPEFQVVNTYPIVLVADGPDPEGGLDFIDLVLSETGRDELQKWGFRAP